jgi:flagellar assembly protein FliH
MTAWSETIKLPAPLRNAVPTGLPPAAHGKDGASRDAWSSGYEQGRIEGERAVNEQLLKQRHELHQILQGTLNSLREAVPQVIHDTESMMVSLALEVARKLVAEMPISVPMVEAAVRDALKHVEGSVQVTIRLHPSDLELLQNAASPLLTSAQAGNDFRFLNSPDVGRGGCLVETRFGTVDARRETKFDLLSKNLLS